MLAIILSIFFPGLGQLYLGKTWRGLAMLVLGITILYPVALIWSILDIIRVNKQGNLPAFDRKQAIWALILFLVVIPMCFFLLGIGSGLVIRKVNDIAQPRLTRKEGTEIAYAIERYRDTTGTLPPTISDLIQGRPPRSGWRTDAWGNNYVYTLDGNHNYTLISNGPDGEPNTADDLIIRE